MRHVKKKLLLAIGVGFLAAICFASFPAFQTISLVVTTNTVPQVLGTNTLHFHTVVFVGMKAPHTNNLGTVWIQFDSTNTAPAIPLAPGAVSAPFNSLKGFDASDFYIGVNTNGDGVTAMLWDIF